MLKILVFVLIAINLVLLSMFFEGLIEQYKLEKEEAKNTVKGGMEGYLEQTFGIGAFKIFKSMVDIDGNVRYLVYLPKYEWFKAPTYQWYEVYATQNGYQHTEVNR